MSLNRWATQKAPRQSSEFNWATDKDDGIVKDLPKARILLYMHESVWFGDYKVKQSMNNVTHTILTCLKAKRMTCRNRPIVLTAHSLGGLIIAKAVAYADTGRELYPVMFEAISAVIFFGTPLKDATIASTAVMFSPLAEKYQTFGAVASKSLEDMTLRNSYLKAVLKEFATLVTKLSPKIHVFCSYEEQPINLAEMVPLLKFASFVFPQGSKILSPKSQQRLMATRN
ncbi:hypothetical protein NEUTE1DRAFT_150792 [Neurospora tetrasperma FGSC 2508]|uniref:DUF676 domain-containing protein n=1 Tax=Neurospora tetrasperma (strain FGSC 2508 / ATCC MYA-4615 / P0657) TaxID=510951 RepID=F8N463_NEUT8|nr:uncharacterized protein NEUTE1DRAFT_150792 [Neurospora tetrasperma FGSC 2508]EGO53506.1 hypothetical protein NEUTE1DRAFT_150792 [Neurospora tetrasperma FGSC 2508]